MKTIMQHKINRCLLNAIIETDYLYFLVVKKYSFGFPEFSVDSFKYSEKRTVPKFLRRIGVIRNSEAEGQRHFFHTVKMMNNLWQKSIHLR